MNFILIFSLALLVPRRAILHRGTHYLLDRGHALGGFREAIGAHARHARLHHGTPYLVGRGVREGQGLYILGHQHELIDTYPSEIATSMALLASARFVKRHLLVLPKVEWEPEVTEHGLA
jgi:hypothetical protein